MIYNTQVAVVEEIDAATDQAAVDKLAGQLRKAGFNTMTEQGPEYGTAYLSENDESMRGAPGDGGARVAGAGAGG